MTNFTTELIVNTLQKAFYLSAKKFLIKFSVPKEIFWDNPTVLYELICSEEARRKCTVKGAIIAWEFTNSTDHVYYYILLEFDQRVQIRSKDYFSYFPTSEDVLFECARNRKKIVYSLTSAYSFAAFGKFKIN